MPPHGPDNNLLPRLDMKYIRDSVLRILNLEKGMIYTVYALSVHPGRALNTYLFADRSRLAKPISFLLLTITIATFLTVNFIDLKAMMMEGSNLYNPEGFNQKLPLDELMQRAGEIFGQYYNLFSLLGVPVLALGSYALFNKKRYNFVEHLAISAYITAIITLLYIVSFPAFMYAYQISTMVYLVLFYIYLIFTYRQLFQCTFWKGVLKSFAILAIYQTVFSFIFVLLGIFLGISYTLQNGTG